MPKRIPIDDQAIAATFFDEGRWLTDFITPEALEVKGLHKKLADGFDDIEDKLLACWDWVANRVKYVRFVKATMQVNGHISRQSDYWQTPSQVIRTRVGNCANKAFLLCSLLRNDLAADKVQVVLGNLHQGGNEGGHAWVEVSLNSHSHIMEATRGDMRPMISTEVADIYEPVIYFSDKDVSAVEGRTLLQPFCEVFAGWLKDYLDWAYIQGRK